MNNYTIINPDRFSEKDRNHLISLYQKSLGIKVRVTNNASLKIAV